VGPRSGYRHLDIPATHKATYCYCSSSSSSSSSRRSRCHCCTDFRSDRPRDAARSLNGIVTPCDCNCCRHQRSWEQHTEEGTRCVHGSYAIKNVSILEQLQILYYYSFNERLNYTEKEGWKMWHIGNRPNLEIPGLRRESMAQYSDHTTSCAITESRQNCQWQKIFISSHNFQMEYWDHPASYPVCTEWSLLWCEP
jgi:hypothetical protein